MATDTDIKTAQARLGRLQQALDALLCGDKRSGLEASTGAGSNRVGYFKPEIAELRIEIAKAEARLAVLQSDRSGVRRAFWL